MSCRKYVGEKLNVLRKPLVAGDIRLRNEAVDGVELRADALRVEHRDGRGAGVAEPVLLIVRLTRHGHQVAALERHVAVHEEVRLLVVDPALERVELVVQARRRIDCNPLKVGAEEVLGRLLVVVERLGLVDATVADRVVCAEGNRTLGAFEGVALAEGGDRRRVEQRRAVRAREVVVERLRRLGEERPHFGVLVGERRRRDGLLIDLDVRVVGMQRSHERRGRRHGKREVRADARRVAAVGARRGLAQPVDLRARFRARRRAAFHPDAEQRPGESGIVDVLLAQRECPRRQAVGRHGGAHELRAPGR
jgi:hypothetical protein